MASESLRPAAGDLQRPPAEQRYAKELAELRKSDAAARPPGWALSLHAVKRFILGDKGGEAKVVCSPALVAEGPSPRALVPAPLHRGMAAGKIVRFEEITRCPAQVQDRLLSALSDRVLAIPEFDDDTMLFARDGFNLIATANTRDRGVREMSAALKRR